MPLAISPMGLTVASEFETFVKRQRHGATAAGVDGPVERTATV